MITQSALYHADVASKIDPRAKEYKDLYAYIISYDCTGLQYCLAIPALTPENPVGLAPKTLFYLISRSYVEPHTNVRPDPSEIILHQVMIGLGSKDLGPVLEEFRSGPREINYSI